MVMIAQAASVWEKTMFLNFWSRKGNSRSRSRPRPRHFRPFVEVLESRLAPATLTVNTAADETAADSVLSLREAINVVNTQSEAGLSTAEQNQISGTLGNNDTIVFDPSLNGQTITLTGGVLSISSKLSITGPGAGQLTVSGNHASGVFSMSAATVSLWGLTIANGNSDSEGGGIAADSSTLTLTNCTFTGNSAFDYGGGVWSQNTVTLTVTNCTFTGNAALGNAGGGIFNDDGTMTVTGSTFADNSAAESEGGGIATDGTVTVTGSTFWGNSASDGGGALEVSGDTTTVTNCTFNGNFTTAGDGGAIDIDFEPTARLTVTNSTLASNSSSGVGGGIAVSTGTVTIANSIIAGNTASGSGPDIAGAVNSKGYNLIGNSSGGSGFVATDLLGFDPRLGPLQNNGGPTQTMALLPGSPALNGGSNALVPAGLTTDQRGPGFARIAGPAVDIGAFEHQAPTIVAPAAQTADTNVPQAIGGLSVGDLDSSTLTVTLAVGHGTLTLGTSAGLVVSNNGTATVSLFGKLADLNAALAGLLYQGSLDYSGSDRLSITAGDGFLSTQASVAITVLSAAQQAAALQAQVDALFAAGVLNKGQDNALDAKLRLQGNTGDSGRVQSFLNQVEAFLQAGILTQAQADALLAPGRLLLSSLMAQ
jgi:CSLREA domain-containing protein